MSKRKPPMWPIIVVMVVIVAIGIGLLSVLTQWKAIDLIKSPAWQIVPEHSEFYTKVLFNVMAREMDRFPQNLTAEAMEEEDIVTILHGTMFGETSGLFDTFVSNSSDGKVAQVFIAVFTLEGDPIYRNILYDRVQYLVVTDNSHDRFKGVGEDNQTYRYKYLKILTAPETGSKFVILTNDVNLTFEQLRIAQIGSDMEGIESFQLFSYSK